LQTRYLSTQQQVSVDINFVSRVTVPSIPLVQQAFIGLLPFREFKKIIVDDAGQIRLQQFYDNVRAFQGATRINEGIATTLRSGRDAEFSILNNGVTIVAKSINTVGDIFTLEDYQIVNGCQTSFVLYENIDKVDPDKLYVPIKLINSTEPDVANSVIIATNSQNEVKAEQLAALSDFQKRLELYYGSIEGDGKLYYERRAKQYVQDDEVTKTRIVTIPLQIKAYAAMFLDVPYRVSRYYGTLLDDIGVRIFVDTHRPSPYYVSALGHYRLENFFRNNPSYAKYKAARFHILMCLRHFISGPDVPLGNSKSIDLLADNLSNVFNDAVAFKVAVDRSVQLLAAEGFKFAERDSFKTQSSSDKLVVALKTAANKGTQRQALAVKPRVGAIKASRKKSKLAKKGLKR
jgi:hypothetical protein